MRLQTAVAQAFEPTGPLMGLPGGYTVRAGQVRMALKIAHSMENGAVLAVEAGTGIGKTFAYLIPALLSGNRMVLSTATKALQDQLFRRDLPRLKAALGLHVSCALLKGRASYLCLHRLNLARQSLDAESPATQRDLSLVESWAAITQSGDMDEIALLGEQSPVRGLVTSTRDNCLGSQCGHAGTCFVNRVRREAMSADLVVINHHLFFADLNIRESGFAELLPSVSCVVFDEAHRLNEIGVQFLGLRFSTAQLSDLCRDLAANGAQLVLASTDWRTMVDFLAQSTLALRGSARGLDCETPHAGRLSWLAEAPMGIAEAVWSATLANIHEALQQIDLMLRSLEVISPVLRGLLDRTGRLMAELDVFSHPVPKGAVRWLDVGSDMVLVQSPLDIADAMRSRVFSMTADNPELKKALIFTSATLGHDATMTGFLGSCGLDKAEILQIESPFNYPEQSALYVPLDMPKPSDPSHSACVAKLVAQGAQIIGGKTLVLTTTLRAMHAIDEALRMHFSDSSVMQILVQGQSPKQQLLDQFCQVQKDAVSGCILVASVSFWEGVDVPGDDLQLVIIDKIPFSAPGDPLVDAHVQQMKGVGINAFRYFFIPSAAMGLKQGAGRLIRSETDRGILVVCDVRLKQRGYGRKILAALPPMQILQTDEEFHSALLALTKPSTTGPCWSERL
jgi:ATP-dependent DNA helicase DinG